MTWSIRKQRGAGGDPRTGFTALGAAVVLGCGLWFAWRGGPVGLNLRDRAAGAGSPVEEIGWIDRRLAAEQAPGTVDSARRECRLAALHWDRAAGLAEHAYYRRFGMMWRDNGDPAYGPFRRAFLQHDRSRDVAATQVAARRALALMPLGPQRVRPLWFLSLACSAHGDWNEAIGALIEITHYEPRQRWVWRQLAETYQARGDFGRQDLAEEQAWRVGEGRSASAYISAMIQGTPYARLSGHRAPEEAQARIPDNTDSRRSRGGARRSG